jgi:CHAT domain-containing protein/Tol biopolymer transport system component/tetratricopeptide (TPR) repeat protein
MNRLAPVVLIAVATAARGGWIETATPAPPVQITSHPTNQRDPAVSPDGRTVAYVSDRSGNDDIWIIPSAGGRAEQLTTHTARDAECAFMPDGKHVVFVSSRDDALGDLYVLRIGKKKATRLAPAIGYDGEPSPDPSGRRVAFASERGDRLRRVWIVDRESGQVEPLTDGGGMSPAWSPDGTRIAYVAIDESPDRSYQVIVRELATGAERIVSEPPFPCASPAWTADGREIVFTRFSFDTDRDGRNTVRDRPVLWTIDLDTGVLSPLSSGHAGEDQAFPSRDGYVYFTSDLRDNADIWRVDPDALIPLAPSAEDQLAFAEHLRTSARESEDLWLARLAYLRVQSGFPEDRSASTSARLEAARLLAGCGYPEAAEEELLGLSEDASDIVSTANDALVDAAQLQLERMWDLDRRTAVRRAAETFESVASVARDPGVASRALLLMGHALTRLGDDTRAVEAYDRAILTASDEAREISAQASLGRAHVLASLPGVGEDAVIGMYLDVVDEYPDQPRWIDSAEASILHLVDDNPPAQRVRAYTRWQSQYLEYRSLRARAGVAKGGAFEETGDLMSAILEWERVVERFPDRKRWVGWAQLGILRARLARGEFDRAVELGALLTAHVEQLDDERLRGEVETELFTALHAHGDDLLAQGDAIGATAVFAEALAIDSGNVVSHRGWIRAMDASGRLEEAVALYRTVASDRPDDPLPLYCIGYALTFRFDHGGGVEALEAARVQLERALDADFAFLPTYRTLSWVYEGIEAETRRVGDRPKRMYYEEAADLATMGLALNDEEKNPSLEADLALNLANNYFNLGQYREALGWYDRRLALSDRFDSEAQETAVLSRIADCGYRTNEYDRTTEVYTRVLRAAKNSDDTRRTVVVLLHMAKVAQSAGEYESSTVHLREAIPLVEATGDVRDLAALHRNISYNQFRQGDYDTALLHAERAEELLALVPRGRVRPRRSWLRISPLFGAFDLKILDIAVVVGASRAEKGFELADDEALVSSLLGGVYRQDEDFEAAIAEGVRRLGIYERHKVPEAGVTIACGIGDMYFTTLEFDSALAYYRRAFETATDINSSGTFTGPTTLCAIAVLQTEMQQLRGLAQDGWPTARCDSTFAVAFADADELESLLSSDLSPFLPGDPTRVRALLLLGALSTVRGEYLAGADIGVPLTTMESDTLGDVPAAASPIARSVDLATRNWRASAYRFDAAGLNFSEALSEASSSRRLTAAAAWNMANAALAAGDLISARDRLRTAQRAADALGDPSLLWRVHHGFGRLLSAEAVVNAKPELLDSAYLSYARAAVVFESAPETEVQRLLFRSDAQDRRAVYEDLAFAAFDAGRPEDAWTAAERGRARRDLDLVTERSVELKVQRHHIYRSNALYLREQIADLRAVLRRALLSGDERKIRRAEPLKRKLADYEAEYARLLDTVRTMDPELVSFIAVQPQSLADVQATLSERGGMLSYWVGRTRTLVFWVDRDVVQAAQLDVGRSALQRTVAEAHRIVATPPPDPSGDLPQRDKDFLDKLGLMLLGAFADRVSRASDLVIVPDGALWYLPFEVLRLEGEYLAEGHRVVYDASASSRLHFRNRRNVNLNGMLTATWGDRSGSLSEAFSGSFGRATRLSGVEEVSLLVDVRAVGQGVVVFDGPVDLTVPHPMDAAIVPRGTDRSPLTTADAFSLDLSANLVVLTDARTGVDIGSRDGRELAALTKAIGYAGAQSIALAQWRPSSSSEFWSGVVSSLGKTTIADAFASGRAGIMRDHPHPHYWAFARVYGYEGMTPEEGTAFAQARFGEVMALAAAYAREGPYRDAARNYEKAWTLAQQMGRQDYMSRLDDLIVTFQVKAAGGEADPRWRDELVERAGSRVERSLDSARRSGDSESELKALRTLRLIAMTGEQYDAAESYEREVLVIMRRADQPAAVGASYFQLAQIARTAGDFPRSITLADSAMMVFSTVGRTSEAAASLNLIALGHLEADDNPQAAVYFERLVRTLEQGDDPLATARVRYLYALTLQRLSRFAEAEGEQSVAFSVFEQRGDSINMAKSALRLAEISWYTGDYEEALNRGRRADSLASVSGELGDRLDALAVLGLIYGSLGRHEEALVAEKEGLALAEKAGLAGKQTVFLGNIGLLYRRAGEFERSLDYARRAWVLDEQRGSRAGMAADARSLALSYEALDSLSLAEGWALRSLELAREVGDRRLESEALLRISAVSETGGSYKRAVFFADSALAISVSADVPETIWRAALHKGRSLSAQGDVGEAERALLIALETAETLRSGGGETGGPERPDEIVEALVHMLIDDGRADEALHVSERARNRVWVRTLLDGRVDVGTGTVRLFSERYREALGSAAAARRKRAMLRAAADPGLLPQMAQAELSAAMAEHTLDSILLQIETRNPEAATLVEVDPIPVEKLASVLPESTCALVFHTTRDALVSWVVSPDGVSAHRRRVSRDSVRALADRFGAELQRVVETTAAGPLYDLLIGPVVDKLRPFATIVLLPDGPLADVPFAALVAPDSSVLVEKHALAYAPSLTSLWFSLARPASPNAGVVSFADVRYDELESDMPFASREARVLSRYYDEVDVRLGRRATESAFIEAMSSARVIHAAVHGRSNPDRPLESRVTLAGDMLSDGELTAREVFGREIAADLVVLSACESAASSSESETAVWPLPRAFLFAGTRSVLAGLRRLDDLATAVTVKRFFRERYGGVPPAEALRRAMLSVRDRVNNHPAYWASLVLVGAPDVPPPLLP